MNIIPIASESLGVRSMATYVETKDCIILIDPSAALTQKRYRLPPLEEEQQALSYLKQKIKTMAAKSDIFVISHYHYDHFDKESKIYRGKKIFAKDIEKNINKSQQIRGKELKDKIKKLCDLCYCDDSTHRFGNTKITFSPPYFHGPENNRLGYVILTTIDDGEKKILHTSDVQGPVSEKTTEYIITQHPDFLIIDGPPTNMLGFRFSKKNLQKASDNLIRIITTLKCEILLDHHLLRDLKYRDAFPDPYIVGKESIKTFAEYLGKKNNTLEAQRKKLWGRSHGI
jgi:predicted metallo-beta-lactamase superfamily hydrolase